MNLLQFWNESFRLLGIRHALLPEERMGPVVEAAEADALLAGGSSIEQLPEAAQRRLREVDEGLQRLSRGWKQAVNESSQLPPFREAASAFALDEFELLVLGAALYAAMDARHARLLTVVQGAQERSWPTLELLSRVLNTTPHVLEQQCKQSVLLRAGLLHWVASPTASDRAAMGELALRPHRLLLQPRAPRRLETLATDPWLQEAGCLAIHADAAADVQAYLKTRVGSLPVVAAASPQEQGLSALQDAALQAALNGGVLLIEGWAAWCQAASPAAVLGTLLAFPIPIAVRVGNGEVAPRAFADRPVVHEQVEAPERAQRLELWTLAMKGSHAPKRLLQTVAKEFPLHAAEIQTIAKNARAQARVEARRVDAGILQAEIRRLQQRPQGGLARVIQPQRGWDELVLPQATLERLREMSAWAQHQHRVREEWGLQRFSPRDRGITALFSGPSGTGKTLAAEVLAYELGCDLVHVDLATVVDKYIGETEKRLRQVFDSIRQGTGVLLFDEADALFGKRTEVRDSHDRYANLGISYLLQLLESFEGIAILTTNLKQNIDPAFLRRLRFSVGFAAPEAAQREALWKHFLSADFPVERLDVAALASHFELTGASIRNVVMRAAFRAAADDAPVDHRRLLGAIRDEYGQLETVFDARTSDRFLAAVGAQGAEA